MNRFLRSALMAATLIGSLLSAGAYEGKWVQGVGDDGSLKLIDQAFDSMAVSAGMAGLPLLYKRDWDGFVESGTAWPGWWIQNSFGPTYGMVPFLEEPYATWLKNAQSMWFRMMADGKTKDANGYVGPDGALCDCALIFRGGGRDLGFGHFGWPHSTGPVNDGKVKMEATYYRQGDAGHEGNDWAVGFAAAGLVMECERLLVTRDPEDMKTRLPQLQRVAAFLDARRDPGTNLLKGGKGSNLLAPGFDGFTDGNGRKPFVYLTELSVNYVAGLDRLAEVCDLAGDRSAAQSYRATAAKVRAALPALMDGQGSFVMYKDPDGVKHGVYGAQKFGYFEATPNHDAVCMRVVDDEASRKIIRRMVSIRELAPHDLIIPNYPAYDEPGYPTGGLMAYGTWVHGGHWSTCQGRMNMACLRADEFDHPFKSWERMCKLMQNFRADAPMGDFGRTPWGGQLGSPFNVVYDCWGVPGGLARGLFEYDYRADGLRIRPHLPPGITRYVQKKAVVFGEARIYLTVTGSGRAASASADGKPCRIDADGWIELKEGNRPVAVEIVCGRETARGAWMPSPKQPLLYPDDPAIFDVPDRLQNEYHVDLLALRRFYTAISSQGLEESYEGAMARTAVELMVARHARQLLRKTGALAVPDIAPIPASNEEAVDDFYVTTALNIAGGLTDYLSGLTLWKDSAPRPSSIKMAKETGLFPRMRTTNDVVSALIPRNGYRTLVGVAQDGSARLRGEIGRVSVFEKAMTAAEMAELATSREALRSGRDCLYSGTPAIGSALPLKVHWTSAKHLTVEAWVKPDGPGRILDKIAAGGSDGFLIDIVGDNRVRAIVGNKVGGQGANQGRTIAPGQWVHTAMVLDQDSRTAAIYLDGREAYDITDIPVQTVY